MSKYNHICVLKGGWSSEREVSLVSGAAIAKGLLQAGYKVTEVDVDKNIYNVLQEIKPEAVFNGLHGTWGEDGCVQGLLETLEIPYTHSGVKASALAMDKILSKKLFASVGIPIAPDIMISAKNLFENEPMERPFVVKPHNDGSSVGVVIVHPGDEFSDDLNGPWREADVLMVEKYIPGRELTVSVMNDRALCVTELKPKAGFYDYKAKYQEGMTDHILPAEISATESAMLMDFALRAHNVLGCRGVSRSDFRMDGNQIYILETNTQPGMTPLSLVPEQANYLGMSFSDLVSWMAEDASCKR